jgi:hypothetical protein
MIATPFSVRAIGIEEARTFLLVVAPNETV